MVDPHGSWNDKLRVHLGDGRREFGLHRYERSGHLPAEIKMRSIVVGIFLCMSQILTGPSAILGQNRAPDVFKRKNVEAKMLLVAKWQLANPKHKLYDWTNGAFYAGIFAAWETTRFPELMTAMIEMGQKNEWKPGPRFDHADDIAINQTYLDLYRIKKDRNMLQPTIDVVERIKNEKGEQAAKKGITWW